MLYVSRKYKVSWTPEIGRFPQEMKKCVRYLPHATATVMVSFLQTFNTGLQGFMHLPELTLVPKESQLA